MPGDPRPENKLSGVRAAPEVKLVLIDAATIIVAIALAGLGIFVGFGKTLEFFTKGIFGFIISVLFCAAFGGLIAAIGPVADGINWLNERLGEAWSFLATIHLATIIYYVLLFVIVQLLRLLIVKCISHIFSLDVFPMRIINRALGAVLMVAAVFMLLLLVFAIIAVFGDTESVQGFAQSLNGTFLGTLYEHNPIRLDAIFGAAAA